MTGRPALYECEVGHHRPTPIRYGFRTRTYLWFVDLDDLPRPAGVPRWLGPLARFDVADHLGDPSAPSIRANVDTFLASNGVDLGGGAVTMLTAARVLGHVFNPLTVYWCHDAEGRLVRTIAEVHNTYGERHCYLLCADDDDRASTDKAFYVSPFEPVAGRYEMRLPEPADRLSISIALDRSHEQPFVAAVTGARRPVSARSLIATALRHPMAPLLVALRIRRHGIALWRRGLRVVARPTHVPQEAVQ